MRSETGSISGVDAPRAQKQPPTPVQHRQSRRSRFAQTHITPRKKRDLWFGILMVLWAMEFSIPATVNPGEKTAERPLQKITIAYSSVSGNMAPLWITYEKGFFRKYGLTVQLVFVEGGSRAAKSLASGDVALAQVAAAGVIQNNLNGADVVMIAGVLNTMSYQFIVDKNIQRPDQLKGKALAVSRFGSSSDFATRFALDKYGLVPDKDVRILEIGTQPARFAALEAGKIQGAMVAGPFTPKGEKNGFLGLP